MRTSRPISIVIILFLLVVIPSFAMAASWLYLGDDNTQSKRYIDLQSLRYNRIGSYVDKSTVDLWIKVEHSQSSKDVEINDAKKFGRYTEKWDNLDYTIIGYKINVNSKTATVSSVNDYDNSGNVLYGKSFDPEFKPIIPDSFGEQLYELVNSFIEDNVVK